MPRTDMVLPAQDFSVTLKLKNAGQIVTTAPLGGFPYYWWRMGSVFRTTSGSGYNGYSANVTVAEARIALEVAIARLLWDGANWHANTEPYLDYYPMYLGGLDPVPLPDFDGPPVYAPTWIHCRALCLGLYLDGQNINPDYIWGTHRIIDYIGAVGYEYGITPWYHVKTLDPEVQATIHLGELPLYLDRDAVLDAYHAFPTHADQLRVTYNWDGDWERSVTCEGHSLDTDAHWGPRTDLPLWQADLRANITEITLPAGPHPATDGEELASAVIQSSVIPLPLDELNHWQNGWPAGGYPDGDWPVRTGNPNPGDPYGFAYMEDGLTLRWGDPANWTDPAGYWPEPPVRMVAHGKWPTVAALSIAAFDVELPLEYALRATCPPWDYDGDPELPVPYDNTRTFSYCKWHTDHWPGDPGDPLGFRLTYTDESLLERDLPTADNYGVFRLGALDSVAGGPYDLLTVKRTSPVSVQCPAYIRPGDPPSWWELAAGSAVLQRLSGYELDIVASAPSAITRALKHHYWSVWSDADVITTWEGELPENAWRHCFRWGESYGKTKAMTADTVLKEDVRVKNGLITEGDDYDYTFDAYLPDLEQEDVHGWENHGFLRLTVTTDATVAFPLTVTLAASERTITDNHANDTDERLAGYDCDRDDTTWALTTMVPAGAETRALYIDLARADGKRPQIVNTVTIAGWPVGHHVLHEVELVGFDPTAGTVGGKVWMSALYPRRRRYGEANMLHPEEYCGARFLAEGLVSAAVPDDECNSVHVGPEGIEAVLHYESVAEKVQDRLAGMGHWRKLVGEWGQEGYTGEVVESWVDPDDAELAAYFCDVDEDPKVDLGDNQDVQPPVYLRAGRVKLADGMHLCLGGSAVPLVNRKRFYGPRQVLALYTGPRRVASYDCDLTEREVGGSDRLVDSYATDAWGLVQFRRGVNEFKHDETGDPGLINPDRNRPDFRGLVGQSGLVPDEATAATHYQLVPRYTIWTPPFRHRLGYTLAPNGIALLVRHNDTLFPTEGAHPVSGMMMEGYSPDAAGGTLPYRSVVVGDYIRPCVVSRPTGGAWVCCEDQSTGNTVVLDVLTDGAQPVVADVLTGYGEPAACLHPYMGNLLVLVREVATGQVWARRWDGSNWAENDQLGAGDAVPGALVMVSPGRLLAVYGASGGLQVRSQTVGRPWATEDAIDGLSHPALCVARAAETPMLLARNTNGEAVFLARRNDVWSDPVVIAPADAATCALDEGPSGKLVAMLLVSGLVRVYSSIDRGLSWSQVT